MTQREYTFWAKALSTRYPALSFVSIQINFWIAANIFLTIILYLHDRMTSKVNHLPAAYDLKGLLILAVSIGIVYGLILGLADYYLFQGYFRNKSLGKVLFIKTGISLLGIVGIITITRSMYTHGLMSAIMGNPMPDNEALFRSTFHLLIFYYFFMTLLISVINMVNKKFGPGVVIPLLFGKYRNPKEEYRIFMFMDLKGSTTLAERLGHLKYSALIQDSFMDINLAIRMVHTEIYQYVGDEIVLTWPMKHGLNNSTFIRFYFECEKRFQQKSKYYLDKYDTLPLFKAGVHMGIVAAVEIGEIKKDIAYHGDTLNTAARIQSLCNEYHKNLLVSETVIAAMNGLPDYKIEKLGVVKLKGREEEIGIVSVEI